MLSNQFYSLIPHDYGYSVPPAINTNEKLQHKAALMEVRLSPSLVTFSY
jgi:hypothetical protein